MFWDLKIWVNNKKYVTGQKCKKIKINAWHNCKITHLTKWNILPNTSIYMKKNMKPILRAGNVYILGQGKVPPLDLQMTQKPQLIKNEWMNWKNYEAYV